MKKIIFMGAFVLMVTSACTLGPKQEETSSISLEEAKTKAVEFINGYLVNEGQEVSIKEVTEENGLYKITVNLANGEETNSYISKDGSEFYPSSMNIEEFKKEASANNPGDEAPAEKKPEVSLADIKKTDKPKVELFVMSHCPFGTQIEKGMLPVIEKLGDKIDFELKFCDYAMHGEKELKEQMTQYCIQKNSKDKLDDYLKCFLADESKSAECIKSLGINQTQLDSCIDATDNEFKIMEQFKDRTSWKSGQYPLFPVHEEDNAAYGVTGSPSLVVNGEKISSGRDSASLLKTVCAGFNNAPEECKAELSSASPAPGFGFEGSGSGAEASCE
jgi:glutaredoxin